MKRTIAQNKILHQLLGDLKISQENKGNMVYAFTGNRTTSSSEMSDEECQAMIDALSRTKNELTKLNGLEMQKKRRDVFKLMYDINLIDARMQSLDKLKVINAWINHKLNLEKKFNDLDINELDKLIRQLQTVRRVYAERAKKTINLN